MVNKENLKILLLLDGKYPGLEAFLEKYKGELTFTIESETSVVNYIITDKNFDTYAALEEKYKCIENRTKIISLVDIKNKVDFFGYNGIAIIQPKWLDHPCLDIYLKRLIFQDASLALHQFLHTKAVQVNQINITNPFSIGHYSDLIAQDAYSSGHNLVSIRNFITGVTSYFAYMQKAHIGGYPLEIQYGQDSSFFVIQCSANCQEFVAEYFWESLEESFDNPFRSLLKIAGQGVDLFDIHYLEKGKKIIFSAIWNTEWIHKREGNFQSLILNQIDSFKQKEKDFNKLMEVPSLAITQSQKNLQEALVENQLPGSFSELLLSRSGVLARSPLKLKRLVGFIVEMRSIQDEESRKTMEELGRSDIGRYLQDYPDKLYIAGLKDYDKDLIIKALNDQQMLDDLNIKILETQEESNTNDGMKEKILDSLLDGLESLDYVESQEFSHIDEDIDQIVDSLIEEDRVVTIKGVTEDVTEAHIRIKGSGAAEGLREKITKIKGSREEIKDEVWKVKRLEVFNDVKAKIEFFKSNNMPLEEIKSELQKIFKEKLGVNDTKSSEFVEGLMENATHEILDENITQKIIKIDESLGNNLVEIKLRTELKDRDLQLARMKKVIDGLKLEVTNQKKLKLVTQSDNPDILKLELEKNIRESSKRAQELVKYKESVVLISEAKDKSVKDLEARISQLTIDKMKNSQTDELQSFKVENKNLKGLLEIAQKRMAGLHNKVEAQSAPKADRAQQLELERMKQTHHDAIEKMQRYRKEKELAFEKVVKLEGLFQQLKQKVEVDKPENKSVDHKDKVNAETIARMRLEVIESSNRSKTVTLKLKEIEQKFRFVTAQLETFQNAKSEDAKANVQAGGKDTAAITLSKLTLLEKQHEKIQSDLKKNLDDLGERKKELVKFKSENIAMRNQLETLERKLAKYEKKAS